MTGCDVDAQLIFRDSRFPVVLAKSVGLYSGLLLLLKVIA
jgi:hypothetical protein